MIKDIFKNPTNLYRGKPFWSWNGKLNKEELIRQIYVMKDMGFGGFFMHSRVGLETEYLGKEWFELINACADEAEKLGMEAWLYDEDRWPSGIAGGIVTKEPQNRAKFIRMHINDIEWNETVIAAFACDLDGLDFCNATRLNYGDRVENKAIVWFDIVEMPKSNFYNGYTYADTLNRSTTDDFIESTHEKYNTNCADRIGNSIKGIFTDEPHRGNVMSSTIYDGCCTPWTYTLFDEFEKRWGYDLREHLPELFLRKNGEAVSAVKWHYMELLQQMFLDNWAKPIHDWCKENHLILTGHVLHENTLAAQSSMQGSLMRFYEHMDYPGVDLLTEYSNEYCVVKQLQSVARQLGQKWLLSEMYGCTGWQFNFEGHKAVGDWQALLGVNLRCHHLSWYTMTGQAKRDYPASILHQSTWHNEYRAVEDYFSRIGLFMQQGTPNCDYVIINPVESVWCQIHAKWVNFVYSLSEQVDLIDEKYKNLYTWLLEAKIDYDIADEEMLSRLYRVKTVNGTPVLVIGNAQYKKVVVSGLTTIRSTTVKILEEFVHAGGEVIFAGEAPVYVDAVPSSAVAQLSQQVKQIPFTKEALSGLKHERFVEVTDSEGNNIDDILLQSSEDENGDTYIMLLNTNRKEGYQANIKIKKSGFLEEWNAKDGVRYAVKQSDDEINLNVNFSPCGEKLYVITKLQDTELKKQPQYRVKATYKLGEPIGYALDEPNICVLDMAKCTVEGERWEEKEILKVDIALRQKYALGLRGGEMLQPWFTANKERKAYGRIRLDFAFYVESVPNDVMLVVENPKQYIIKVNGSIVDKTDGGWIDICFTKLPIHLIEGYNVITMETEFKEDTDLEAIYLLGDFGVQLEGTKKTIVKLPHKISYGDLGKQGLPFYSGKIKYLFKNPVNERAQIRFDSLYGAACLKVHDEIIGWQPYTAEIQQGKDIEVELVLTRRNTFGPLHEKDLYVEEYGPDNFVTEDEHFSDDYVLLPTGIAKEPMIEVIE